MGTIFEELIRKFAELSNETAGEHFTPREVIRLMVNLIFAEDDEALSMPGVVRTVRNLRRSYDFAQFIDAGSNIADRIVCVSQSSQVPGHVGNNNGRIVTTLLDRRQTAPYSSELEPNSLGLPARAVSKTGFEHSL